MKAPSIRARREAVERALDAAPIRTSADQLHRQHLIAAAALLSKFESLTEDQIYWLIREPEAQAAVRAAYRAAKGEA